MIGVRASAILLAASTLVCAQPASALVPAARTSTLAQLSLSPKEPIHASAPAEEEGANMLMVSLVSAAMGGAVLGAGAIAWWDRGFDQFQFADTGFFGRDTYAGGSDKLGHFYTSYASMMAMGAIYEGLGVSHDNSILGASIFTFLLWNGFELIDGFTDYGVEYGDIVMNSLGIGLGAVMQLYPELEDWLGFRLGYIPSKAFLRHDRTIIKFINDYAGMTYFLDLKLKGPLTALDVDPGLGRYLVAGLVHSTDHYSPVRNDALRRRSFGVHVGLSLAEIMRAWGDGDEGVNMQARFFDFYAVPFLQVALMRDLNGRDWYLNFGVSNRAEIGL